jgi:hypothetical protein
VDPTPRPFVSPVLQCTHQSVDDTKGPSIAVAAILGWLAQFKPEPEGVSEPTVHRHPEFEEKGAFAKRSWDLSSPRGAFAQIERRPASAQTGAPLEPVQRDGLTAAKAISSN